MSTRKPASMQSQPTTGASASTAAATDMPRQQMAAAARGACVVFRGFESVRKVQQKAAHDALLEYTAMAEKLRQPCAPADLLAIQGELLRFDFHGAALYWQQLGAVVLETQRQFLATLANRPADDDMQAPESPFQAYMPTFNEMFGFNGSRAGSTQESAT